MVADTSLSGRRVVRELDAIAARPSYPASMVSDNGTELTSSAVLPWSQDRNVGWHYIAPGKPQQNAFVTRVIRYRRERWATPDGQTVLAPLPSGVAGHFAPDLRRFVLAQHDPTTRLRRSPGPPMSYRLLKLAEVHG